MLRHVSIIRPSSGSCLFLAKITLLKTFTACLFLDINQLDALNFIISLFQASTYFEHMCSSSRGQKLYYTVSGIVTLKQVNGLKLLK